MSLAASRASWICLPATTFRAPSSSPVTPPSTTPDLVEKLLEAGHEIAHHGYLHLRSDKVSTQAQTDEIEKGLEGLRELGVPEPKGYRSTSLGAAPRRPSNCW